MKVKIMKVKKNKVSYLLFGIFLYTVFYISGIIKLFETIISLIIYALFFYGIYIIWKKIRKKEYLGFNQYLSIFIYKITLFIYLTVIFIGLFAYYNNELYPAKMPEYTITDGKKIVVFQAMSHIATQDFYNQIQKNIKKFKLNGGVYFYEGVKPGSKESNKKFDEALGVNFTPDLYKNMSKLYGVTFQDNNQFMGLVNNLDFNIDLNLDEIIKIYESKKKINNKEVLDKTEIVNASEEIMKQLNYLSDNELKVLIYLNQALLNLIIRNDKEAKELIKGYGNQDLFSVILDDRNNNLANEIIKTNYDKIYITYGLLHFEGVYKILKKNNSKWKIKNISYLYPIK